MKKLTEAELHFITRMGQHTQAYGLSRIAGQILAVLVVSDTPINSAEIMTLLKISKGSVSTNVRFLEMLHIVERKSLPGKRQDHFSVRENAYLALVEVQIQQLETAKEIAAEARDTIKNPTTQKKIAELETFYTLYHKSSKALLEQLKSEPTPDEN